MERARRIGEPCCRFGGLIFCYGSALFSSFRWEAQGVGYAQVCPLILFILAWWADAKGAFQGLRYERT